MSTAAASAAANVPVTESRMLEIVFPDHTNHLGTLFGGQALAWMDKAAFIAESIRADAKWTTVVDQLNEALHVDAVRGQPSGQASG